MYMFICIHVHYNCINTLISIKLNTWYQVVTFTFTMIGSHINVLICKQWTSLEKRSIWKITFYLYTITYTNHTLFDLHWSLILMQQIKINKTSLRWFIELNCVSYLLFIATKYVHFPIYNTGGVPIPGIRNLSIDLRCWPL